MSEKQDFIYDFMSTIENVVDMNQFTIIKDSLHKLVFNYDIKKITNTELSTTNGEATEWLIRYLHMCYLSRGISKNTISQYDIVIRQLCDFVHKELNMITPDDLMFFLTQYGEINHCTKATMETKRLYLNSVFSTLKKQNKIAVNPMDSIYKIKSRQKKKVPLTDEEIERIKIACENDKRLTAMIYIMLDSGVRVSELCNLRLCDIDFEHRKLTVVSGKGNKDRIVDFSGRSAERLRDYLRTRVDLENRIYPIDTPLFVTNIKPYRKLSTDIVGKEIKDLGKAVGIERLTPHLFRATYATILSKRGVPINIVAHNLGHADLNTISRYVIMDADTISAEMIKAGATC